MDQECDYNSPVGQIIKQINALCKKPKIDNELRSALELFSDKINHQKKFMNNGIFTINFAEAALFLQSCAELYGKKVDLLWDQLLEFHTRLIEYDCAHEKEKGKKVNDEVIKQLEERRNRYKRKKKFKLMLAQEDNLERFLFDKPINEDKDKLNTFEPDETLQRAWKSLEVESSKIKSVPNAVYKQQLTMYRMKNYYTMKSQDFDIFDAEDGEFNTKYSRVPGWHHIEHLFEYNTKGLLPDKNNLIATLRLGAYLRVKFLRDRKIPFSAPYTEYKEEYLAYRRQFFEAEGEKWQNMPLNTLDDLHKQLEFLSQKEQGIDDETEIDTHNVSSTSPNPDPGTGKETNSNVNHISDRNSLEEMLDECDDDSLFELSIGCPTELSNSDLFVRLEKLSSDIITKKYRQDSGFFGSDVDCDEEVNVHNTEVSAPVEMSTGGETIQNVSENRTEISDANLENSVMTAQNQKEDTAENGASTIPLMADKLPENENLLGTVDTNHPHTVAMESVENCSAANTKSTQMFPDNIDREQDKENLNPHAPNICDDTENLENSDDFETRSIMSDHSYCRTSSPRRVLEENNNVPIDKNVNAATKDVMTPFVSSRTRIIPRVVKTKPPREKVKFKVPAPNPSPPKRRKLSSKQVEKLFNSLIVAPAVKEMKFEKFFSQNYQPQLGEGEITEVNYDSEASDADENVEEPPPVENQTKETDAVRDQDDVRSIFSDHSYCQRSDRGMHDDSGYISVSHGHPSPVREEHENIENFFETSHVPLACGETLPEMDGTGSATDQTAPPKEVISRDDVDSPTVDGEYQRLLNSLRESRKEQGNEDISPIAADLQDDQQSKEQDKRESRARVSEWRSTITPILQNLKERDFNIHEYGSHIMEDLNVDETKAFSSIVEGKSSAEVVRYFIASLQLANTYNIEICGAKKGKLSNDSYNIKLLKKDRYHEHLTDYQAPSEESFRERLKRVRSAELEDETEPTPKHQRFIEPLTTKRKRKSRTFLQSKACRISSIIEDEAVFPETIGQDRTQAATICRKEVQIKIVDNLKSMLPIASKSIMKCASAYEPQMSPILTPTPTSRHVHFSENLGRVRKSSISDRHLFSDQSFSSTPRRELTEETFRFHLDSMQEENPELQMYSTPLEERQSRLLEPFSSGKSLLFD